MSRQIARVPLFRAVVELRRASDYRREISRTAQPRGTLSKFSLPTAEREREAVRGLVKYFIFFCLLRAAAAAVSEEVCTSAKLPEHSSLVCRFSVAVTMSWLLFCSLL